MTHVAYMLILGVMRKMKGSVKLFYATLFTSKNVSTFYCKFTFTAQHRVSDNSTLNPDLDFEKTRKTLKAVSK